jgi:hypothetical protein
MAVTHLIALPVVSHVVVNGGCRRLTTSEQPLLLWPSCVRQQSDIASLLDRGRESPLVWRANPGQPPWDNLPALRHELSEQAYVLVVDCLDLLHAEFADLLAPEILASALARTTGTTARTRAA